MELIDLVDLIDLTNHLDLMDPIDLVDLTDLIDLVSQIGLGGQLQRELTKEQQDSDWGYSPVSFFFIGCSTC